MLFFVPGSILGGSSVLLKKNNYDYVINPFPENTQIVAETVVTKADSLGCKYSTIDPRMSGWNTIESDAGVFTELVDKLGIRDIQFEELYSFDAETLRSLGQVYGVIFLFHYTTKDQTDQPITGAFSSDESIFFAQQTINNACATQAVLNILLNKPEVNLGPELGDFKEFVGLFDPALKGETISNSETIRTVHNSFSSPNSFIDEQQSHKLTDDDELYHFVGFIEHAGRIVELDGLKQAPIDHGSLEEGEDFYTRLPKVLNERIGHYAADELRFSLLAIIKDKRIALTEAGDLQELANEEYKRQQWHKENEIRRLDLIGLVHDTTKALSKIKTDEEWREILRKAGNKK